MYEEQYSSKAGPSRIWIEGEEVRWSLNIGGVEQTGSVPLDEHGQEAGLARARKAVDAAALGGDNAPSQAAPPASESVVAEPPTGEDKVDPSQE